MILGEFGGVGVWLRMSTSSADDGKCLDPFTSCFFETKVALYEDIGFSTNAQVGINPSSRLLLVLTSCPFDQCALYELDCSTASTSTKVTMAAAAPWTITISQANSAFAWEESMCVKCSSSGRQMILETVKFMKLANQGECDWTKVRHVQEGSSTWHPSTDQMAGTDVYGSSSDNSQPWGIKFDYKNFNQILFATNNLQHFTIMDSSTFTQGEWINGLMIANIRSSLTTAAPGTSKIYYRSGTYL
jgi:hypothetical protein